MFSNILVALDGSEVSLRALGEAVYQAKTGNAKLQAIYTAVPIVLDSLSMDPTYRMENTLEMERILEREGEVVLKNAKKYCAENGITLITHMKYGDAGREIMSLAEEEKIDLIVIGSHGKSDLDRLLIGSVSSFVVTHNKVTTMVVR